MDATPLSLAEYASRLRSREQTAVGLVERCTQNYARTESRLNAYKTWDGARARGVAGAVDTLLDQGIDLGPLMGIPVSVKDMYGVPGLPVFAGSAEALPEAWQAAGPIVAQLQRQLGQPLRRHAGDVLIEDGQGLIFVVAGHHHNRARHDSDFLVLCGVRCRAAGHRECGRAVFWAATLTARAGAGQGQLPGTAFRRLRSGASC